MRKKIISRFILNVALISIISAGVQPRSIAAQHSRTVLIRSAPSSAKLVALTFDDGPSPTFTPKILDILKQYHAKATFFVIGNRIKEQITIIRREIAEGHEIANHSFHHKILTDQLPATIESELTMTEDSLHRYVGVYTAKYLRPPRGKLNQQVMRVARQHGYRIILWRVDSRDWENPGTYAIVKHVLKETRNGDIILFHDQGGSRRQTVEALQQIIPALEGRGYQLVTVSRLLSTNHQQHQ